MDLEKTINEALEQLQKQKEVAKTYDAKNINLIIQVNELEERLTKTEIKNAELSILLESALKRIQQLESQVNLNSNSFSSEGFFFFLLSIKIFRFF